jgi:hypothetical protein
MVLHPLAHCTLCLIPLASHCGVACAVVSCAASAVGMPVGGCNASAPPLRFAHVIVVVARAFSRVPGTAPPPSPCAVNACVAVCCYMWTRAGVEVAPLRFR